MNKHPLYDIAVAEVRGAATPDEEAQLKSNVFEWKAALESVIDEVDSQLEYKTEEYEEDLLSSVDEGDEKAIRDAARTLKIWKSRARVFKKHVSARLRSVKRMCEEQSEIAQEVGEPHLEAVMNVATHAIRLVEVDADGDEEEFDEAFEKLVFHVNDLLETRGDD